MQASRSRYLIGIGIVFVSLLLTGAWPMLLRTAALAAPEAVAGIILSEAGPVFDSTSSRRSAISFIENAGQFDDEVRYLLRHGSRLVWLTDNALWISALDNEALGVAQQQWQESGQRRSVIPGAHLRVGFAGADSRPAVEPFDRLSTRVSYFVGEDPSAWQASVPVWGGVRYRDLYPGIDLVLSSGTTALTGATSLPWHLEVDEGADLSAVQLTIDGPDALAIMDGEIHMSTAAGQLSTSLLLAKGKENGLSPAAELAVTEPSINSHGPRRFLLTTPLRFEAASQLSTPETPADATDLAYSTYLGGSGNADFGEDVAVDDAGAAYVAGHTQSTDFPTTPGAYTTTLQARDAFVAKFDPTGNGTSDLIYSTFIGGGSFDNGLGIEVVNGQAHLVGVTASRSFPTTSGAFQESCGSDALCDSFDDAFLTVLNSDGTALIYSTFLGGQDQDTANAIAISGGELYIAGETFSEDFPTTSGAFDRDCGSNGRCDSAGGVPVVDGFFVKMVAAGNSHNDLLYGTFLGGWAADEAKGIAATGGDAVVIGNTSSPDFPVSPGGASYSGEGDAFVMRLSPAGEGASDRVFGLFLGGTGNDTGAGIDAIGNTAVAVGLTRSETTFPVTAGSEPFHGGFSDAYVVWLDGAGVISYGAFLGGLSLETAESVALDGRGGAVLTGYTFSSDFPTEGAYDDSHNGGYDLFVSRMDLNSTQRSDFLTYSSFLGGSADDEGYGLDLDSDGYAYLTGLTLSTDFPTTSGAFSTIISGTRDIFFSKLLAAPPPGIDIEKSTNGFDADEPTGPYMPVGSQVNWRYVITNTGGFTLTNVQVTDDQLGLVCSRAALSADDSFFCEVTSSAAPDQYFNAATVTADAPPELGLDPITDIDLSHYFGAVPLIEIEKYTNGQKADDEPGPFIRVGEPVTWTFLVTNTGNVRLSGIVVTDSVEGPTLCDYTSLERNQKATCVITATNGSVAGAYANTGYVVATPPGGLADVTDHDDSHYFGADPSVVMQKLTAGQLARDMPGPYIVADELVTWTYVITNTGNVPVMVTAVIDDQDVDVSCPNPELSVDGWTTCEGSDLAVAGQYTNTAEVQAAPPVGADVTAADISHYYGVDPGVSIKKLTNGHDADEAPGPFIPEGDAVNWSYIVTNTGNITLTTVTITDSEGVTVSCDAAPIAPGGSKLCTASGVAVSGQYSNTGTVAATPLFGPQVMASDTSHYYGSSPAITVVKRTNGVIARTEPGPGITVDGEVLWSYELINSGNITLTSISVTDNKLGVISCPGDTLGQGETVSCQASGVATAGQYSNTVTVVGSPPVGDDATGGDLSHYYGVEAEISLKKLINGQAGDSLPGPYILVDDPVTWTFVISNTGNSQLTEIALIDDRLGNVNCPLDELASKQQMICEVSGLATAGQHTNTATVEGKPPVGPNVTAHDGSHYFGVAPQVAIKKFTNGQDAAATPGPFIPEGEPVSWSYVVTNTGNITLTTIEVTDSKGIAVDCAASSLGLDEETVCTGSGTAQSGQYSNTGLVTATPLAGPQVTASDLSHYYGSSPAITLVKRTNGQIARVAPGPYILVDDPVNWAYEVTNSGNITLTSLALVDEPLGKILCPKDSLGMGETMSCSESGLAAAGQYSNTATITGTPPVGEVVTAADISHYFGSDPDVVMQKLTNGQDADEAPGPLIPEGDAVNWSYIVTNTGNITLTTVMVTDSEGVTVSCDAAPIGPEGSKLCTASGVAVSGQYSNTGTVAATPLFGPQVMASDTSHYYGSSPAITVVKRTNGVIARTEPGPGITVDGEVLWSYELINSGNITLTSISVTDNKLGVISCPGDTLGQGETVSCQVSGVATAGQYSNTVTVVGSPPVGDDATGGDLSHYYGVEAEISLKKLINGQAGDSLPGPYILVDDPVTWTFVISNTGNSQLTEIALTDDQLEGVSCPLDSLASGQQMICEVTGLATAGQHTNTATVEGRPPIGPAVSAQDNSHYYGVDPGVATKKLTNSEDAKSAPGPYIMENDPVTWTYIVTNTGNITLTTVAVTDNKGEAVTCDETSLGLDSVMTCTASATAGSGQYSNIGSVIATPLFGPQVTASDTSHYFGVSPELTLVKRTNGQIARSIPGPYILVNDPVIWTYEVTNNGNISLSAVTVKDGQLGEILCPKDVLGVGESMSCERSSVAMIGQYTNTAIVTGTPTANLTPATAPLAQPLTPRARLMVPGRASGEFARPFDLLHASRTLSSEVAESMAAGQGAREVTPGGARAVTPGGASTIAPGVGAAVGEEVAASDISHYFGADPVLTIKKYTNGIYADKAPGPIVDFSAGEWVTWTIMVSNTGNVPLKEVLVTDDNGTPGDSDDDFPCDFGDMDVGAAVESCTFSAPSVAGQYTNVASASAAPPGDLKEIANQASSHYFGSDPALSLTKLTNGFDVESPPGPPLVIDRPVLWTFQVLNTGNITLTQLTIVDHEGMIIDPAAAVPVCEIAELGPGMMDECSLEGIAISGEYTNTAVVTAHPPVGDLVNDDDTSYYLGTAGLYIPMIIKS